MCVLRTKFKYILANTICLFLCSMCQTIRSARTSDVKNQRFNFMRIAKRFQKLETSIVFARSSALESQCITSSNADVVDMLFYFERFCLHIPKHLPNVALDSTDCVDSTGTPNTRAEFSFYHHWNAINYFQPNQSIIIIINQFACGWCGVCVFFVIAAHIDVAVYSIVAVLGFVCFDSLFQFLFCLPDAIVNGWIN